MVTQNPQGSNLNLEMVSMELTGKADAPSSVSDLWPYIGKGLVLQEEVV